MPACIKYSLVVAPWGEWFNSSPKILFRCWNKWHQACSEWVWKSLLSHHEALQGGLELLPSKFENDSKSRGTIDSAGEVLAMGSQAKAGSLLVRIPTGTRQATWELFIDFPRSEARKQKRGFWKLSATRHENWSPESGTKMLIKYSFLLSTPGIIFNGTTWNND